MLELALDLHHPLAHSDYVLLHQAPGRCRFRVARLRADGSLQERIRHRLGNSSSVSNFRLNTACESLTVVHTGTVSALLDLLTAPSKALALRPSQAVTLTPTQPANLPNPFHAMAWAAGALVLGPAGGFGLDLLLIALTGLPIWRRAVITLAQERRLNVDFLDGLALGIAVLRRQPRTAALMAMMVHLGDVVRELTARQSQGQIRQLLDFQAVQARRLEANGSTTLVAAQALRREDLTLMLAGDLLPADGMICSGLAAVDQRHITGESVPATRRVGDMVFAGSSIVEGSITVRITEVGDATVVAKIVQVIEAAPVGETRIQNYAEQFADRLVAPLLDVNVGLLALTGNVDRFMSMAIVDYGTGIRVAAPTSILASMTRAARQGVVIKSGHHLEQMASLRGIAFDKTGTLTCGHLAVVDIKSLHAALSADQLLQLAAAAETQLRHPVARALVTHAQQHRGLVLPECEDVQFTIGMGVTARIAGRQLQVGSERFLRSQSIATGRARSYLAAAERQGHIVLLLALDDSLVGAIACTDAPRPEARTVVAGLKARGVKHIVMLSGDREGVARRVADQVGIDTVYSEVLPQDKAEIVRSLRLKYGSFAMVGDGVNDSPALAQADVGISMADGADIARAAADIVLMEEGLHLLLPAMDICRDGLALVQQNFRLIAGANTLALALAVPAGLMSPMVCTLISNGSGLLATLNAMRPLLPGRRKT